MAQKKAASKKTTASRRGRGTARPLGLRLERYRVLLEAPEKLARLTRKQVTRLLEEEGGGSIGEATANEEWSMERVDVVDDQDETRYQLYLWPFGSGALLQYGLDYVFTDQGGNSCGCPEAADVCQVLSANLEPPTGL